MSPWPSAGIPISRCPAATANRRSSTFPAPRWPLSITTATFSPPATSSPSRAPSTTSRAPQGKALDDIYLDDNWSKLQRTNGAVDVTLADPASNYGVHILGLSPEIRTVQVYAPPTKQFAAIEEQFNFADPFGKEWGSMNTGMVTLHPGKSVEWHVRLALFQPNK